ncbi:MAG: TIGR00730 family Rossman fold protein [Phycisphaerales bacterium]
MTKSTIKSVCVYCGSRVGARPEYAELAREMGREMARRGITLVFGGGRVGLMGIIADTVLGEGGRVVGVIPEFMVAAERAHHGCTELIVVQTMHERKQTMSDRCDAIVTMPGGVGAMDELFEAITWNVLGVHDRPLGVLDVGGYYEPLRTLIEHGVTHGFIDPGVGASIHWSSEPGDLLDAMGARAG